MFYTKVRLTVRVPLVTTDIFKSYRFGRTKNHYKILPVVERTSILETFYPEKYGCKIHGPLKSFGTETLYNQDFKRLIPGGS